MNLADMTSPTTEAWWAPTQSITGLSEEVWKTISRAPLCLRGFLTIREPKPVEPSEPLIDLI